MKALFFGLPPLAFILHPLLILLLAACSSPPSALPSLTPVPTPVPGGLYVDAAQSLGPISPYVYGTNYGPWTIVPVGMQDEARAAGLTFMRFPGGNWGDQHDLEEWQIDQFLGFAQQMGWEPMIHVRLRDSTPEKAAALVEYVNRTKGYNVRYWAIGNEPNYYEADTESYNRRWRQWAEAMRAVDATITLVGPETDGLHLDETRRPKDRAGRDWMIEFLKANGDLVDVVAFHLYPFPLNPSAGAPSIADLRQNTQDWEPIIARLREDIHAHTGRAIPIALTEVNSSWAANSGGEATMDSHYNAIWWGDVLGRLIRQDVSIVAHFAIIGLPANRFGLMNNRAVHPVYYVYQLYQRFGVERVYASSDDPFVSIVAARRADRGLTLMIVNLESHPVEKTLRLENARAASAETWRFDAAHAAVPVEPTPLEAATRLALPAESMTLLILPP